MQMQTNDRNAFAALFADRIREDAGAVYKEMQVPTALRLRADDQDDSHPLLAMRLSRMSTLRTRIHNYGTGLVEGRPPLTTVKEQVRFLRELELSVETCMRVLECSDASDVKTMVQDSATAIGNSIAFVANVLDSRQGLQPLAQAAKNLSIQATTLSQSVDMTAAELKESYSAMVITLVTPGDRLSEPADSPSQGL